MLTLSTKKIVQPSFFQAYHTAKSSVELKNDLHVKISVGNLKESLKIKNIFEGQF